LPGFFFASLPGGYKKTPALLPMLGSSLKQRKVAIEALIIGEKLQKNIENSGEKL
jgi:hypothetical protein